MATYTIEGINLTIPGRIRSAMDRAGIHRQADLARASGVSEVTISNIMLLKNGPSPSTLRKIANALGVTEEYLRGVERYRPESNSTRCWTCQNAVPEIRNGRQYGCSWSRCLEPVEGWEAIPITKATGDGALKAGTYRVKSCPEYIPDEVKEE